MRYMTRALAARRAIRWERDFGANAGHGIQTARPRFKQDHSAGPTAMLAVASDSSPGRMPTIRDTPFDRRASGLESERRFLSRAEMTAIRGRASGLSARCSRPVDT